MSGATTADIAEALHELRDAVARLDSKVETVRSEVRAEMTRLDGKLDARFDRLDTKIEVHRSEAHGDIVRLGERLDRLSGQIIAKMPSLWQLPAVIGASAAILAALYAAAQFLRLHGWWPG
jgi:hypothetical protein